MANKIEVLSERTKIPADGKTATKLCLRFAQTEGSEFALKLTRGGSFEKDETVKEAVFPIVNDEVNLTVYAPRRPCNSYLLGEGFRHRIDFVAASFMQGLIYEWVPTLLYAMVFALILRTYAVASFIIPSGSMRDTLIERDLLIADKLSYKVLGRDPQRGDVMIFKPPNENKKDYIKRVIGLPGDTIEVRNGVVYVNDEPLSEGVVRITAQASYDRWAALDESSYRLEKLRWYDRMVDSAVRFVPDFRSSVIDTDIFTPTTIRRYTGHENGAVYGAAEKRHDGTTHLKNLFLCGTDQGLVGIVGSIISGITIANKHFFK